MGVAIKDLFRTHRSLPPEHARRAVEWKLNSLTAEPRDLWGLVRPEQYAPPRSQRNDDVVDEPIGPTMGTDFSWRTATGFSRAGPVGHTVESGRHAGSHTHNLAYNPITL